jgi:hypothetical protein
VQWCSGAGADMEVLRCKYGGAEVHGCRGAKLQRHMCRGIHEGVGCRCMCRCMCRHMGAAECS